MRPTRIWCASLRRSPPTLSRSPGRTNGSSPTISSSTRSMTSNPCSGEGRRQLAELAGFSHIELSYVTTCYFNQTDSSSVVQLLRRYASYSGDLLDRLQFVLVDDGSPVPVTLPADFDLNVLLLRIL